MNAVHAGRLWDGGRLAIEIALAALLGISAAHWTWVLFSPTTVAEPSSGAEAKFRYVSSTIKRNLFGAVQEGRSTPAAESSPASGIRLIGLISRGASGSGRAIIALDSGRPRIVEVGSQILQGVTLKEIHSDHALIVRHGVTERLRLERKTAAKRP